MNSNDIVYASLSVLGIESPWSDRRGFDSMAHLCTGVSSPKQNNLVMDHRIESGLVKLLVITAGHFLALSVLIAFHGKIVEGGSDKFMLI